MRAWSRAQPAGRPLDAPELFDFSEIPLAYQNVVTGEVWRRLHPVDRRLIVVTGMTTTGKSTLMAQLSRPEAAHAAGCEFPGFMKITVNELQGRGWNNLLHQLAEVWPRRKGLIVLQLEKGEANNEGAMTKEVCCRLHHVRPATAKIRTGTFANAPPPPREACMSIRTPLLIQSYKDEADEKASQGSAPIARSDRDKMAFLRRPINNGCNCRCSNSSNNGGVDVRNSSYLVVRESDCMTSRGKALARS